LKLSPRTTTTFTLGLLMAGLIAGCATTVTNTPSPEPTVSADRQAAGVTCADGGACAVGDIGPAGGIIFSIDPVSGDATILEPAARGWSGATDDVKLDWDAALARAEVYDGGGKIDWFLPTMGQLQVLYKFNGRNTIGGFTAGRYWSKDQPAIANDPNLDPAFQACSMTFVSGSYDCSSRIDEEFAVRPVRTWVTPLR